MLKSLFLPFVLMFGSIVALGQSTTISVGGVIAPALSFSNYVNDHIPPDRGLATIQENKTLLISMDREKWPLRLQTGFGLYPLATNFTLKNDPGFSAYSNFPLIQNQLHAFEIPLKAEWKAWKVSNQFSFFAITGISYLFWVKSTETSAMKYPAVKRATITDHGQTTGIHYITRFSNVSDNGIALNTGIGMDYNISPAFRLSCALASVQGLKPMVTSVLNYWDGQIPYPPEFVNSSASTSKGDALKLELGIHYKLPFLTHADKTSAL